MDQRIGRAADRHRHIRWRLGFVEQTVAVAHGDGAVGFERGDIAAGFQRFIVQLGQLFGKQAREAGDDRRGCDQLLRLLHARLARLGVV